MLLRIKKTTNQPTAATPPPAAPKQQAFFTVSDLAKRWGLSERHIRRLIENGQLSAHRIGRAVRVSPSNVALFEARCTGDM